MAFADPQSVSIGGTAVSLPRISVTPTGSIYRNGDGDTMLSVSQTGGKRTRTAIRLNHSKVVEDPLSGNNIESSMSVTLVVDVPKYGYNAEQRKLIADALVAYASASSGANLDKALGGQS